MNPVLPQAYGQMPAAPSMPAMGSMPQGNNYFQNQIAAGAFGPTVQAYMHLAQMPANDPLSAAAKNYMMHVFQYMHGATDIAPSSAVIDNIIKQRSKNFGSGSMGSPRLPQSQPQARPNPTTGQPITGTYGGVSTGANQAMYVRPSGSSVYDQPNTSTQFGPAYSGMPAKYGPAF